MYYIIYIYIYGVIHLHGHTDIPSQYFCVFEKTSLFILGKNVIHVDTAGTLIPLTL